MDSKSFTLTLTKGEAEYLLRVFSIGRLTIDVNTRTGNWLPPGAADARAMSNDIKQLQVAPTLEDKLRSLGAGLNSEEGGKS